MKGMKKDKKGMAFLVRNDRHIGKVISNIMLYAHILLCYTRIGCI